VKGMKIRRMKQEKVYGSVIDIDDELFLSLVEQKHVKTNTFPDFVDWKTA